MGSKANDFWGAARAFRAPPNAEAKHQARVALLRLAIGDTGPIGERAAETLRKEGLVVIRQMPVLYMRMQ